MAEVKVSDLSVSAGAGPRIKEKGKRDKHTGITGLLSLSLYYQYIAVVFDFYLRQAANIKGSVSR